MQETYASNGVREALGELRGDVKALLREMAAIQDRQNQLQQAFAEVAAEFAQHIAIHIEQDKQRIANRWTAEMKMMGVGIFLSFGVGVGGLAVSVLNK